MKRNIQALFAVFLLSANVGATYAQDTTQSAFTEKDITKTDLKGNKGLFANGNAITIEAGSDGKTKVTATGSNEVKEIDGSQYIIFGGKYDDDCETTNITMKGGSVKAIVGGGYGTTKENSADVSGTTTINITGGTITNMLIGGGAYYATSKKADITISDVIMGSTAWILGSIESGNATGPSSKYPEFKDATCKLAEMDLTITGGTFGYIALTGGNGYYAYTQKGTANITGTGEKPIIFKGGLFGCGSNGRGDEAKATLDYCNFTEPYSGGYFEIASVNRGKLKTVDFTFKRYQ